MSRDYSSGQLVGIDLHRRRSVICRLDADGEVVESVRIDNDRAALLREVAKAGRARRWRSRRRSAGTGRLSLIHI